MSSPFYAPRPVYIPFSGNCDTSGNLTIKLPPLRDSAWVTVKMMAKVSSGNPTWELLAGGPLDASRGQRCSMASVILPPTAAPILNVIGAAPGAAVTGSFIGVETYSPEQAVQWTALVPSMVGAEIAFPSSIQLWGSTQTATPGTASLPTITAGQNNQNFFVNIPPGTRALRVLAVNATQGSTAAFTYSMRVEGSAPFQSPPFISGAVLTLWPQGAGPGVLKAPSSPGTPVYVPVEPIWGLLTGPFTTPQVKFIITGDPNVDLQFFISALFDIESVDITTQQPLPIQGISGGVAVPVTPAANSTWDVSDRIARQLGRAVLVDTGNLPLAGLGAGSVLQTTPVSALNTAFSATNPLFVQEGTSPPAWQVPNKVPVDIGAVIAAAGVLNLVTAVVGQTVRLFSCPLAVDAVLATGTINLEDTGNTKYHEFSTSTSPANPFISPTGVALPIGLGVQLRNPAGSAQTVRGSLVYSQS